MNRYMKLLDLIKQEKPSVIVEIGTWNGDNAVRMLTTAAAALQNTHKAHLAYIGFDLFEEGTAEQDRYENNAKQRVMHRSVEEKLERLADQLSAPVKGNGVATLIRLVSGNTRETLPIMAGIIPQEFGPVDFAFVDGGHSLETILQDMRNLWPLMRPGGLIVNDDFYRGVNNEYLNKWGCNQPLQWLGEPWAGKATVLPGNDPLRDGGTVHLALLRVPHENVPVEP
jgi:predicted O-methyltransferase YrrM